MRHTTVWAERISRKNGKPIGPIYSACWNPDGSRLLVSADTRVLMYSAKGDLLKNIERDTMVYGIAYSPDGNQFAVGSGPSTKSLDKPSSSVLGEVVIFSSAGSAQYRYQHKGRVTCLSYSSGTTPVLVSVSEDELIICGGMESRLRQKKISCRILGIAWSPDGKYFATGDEKGNVVIRDSNGDTIRHEAITRGGAVWALTFSPHVLPGDDPVLLVTAWDGTVTQYHIDGRPVGRSIDLPFLPLCTAWRGQYLLVGGTDGQVHFLSKEGVLLHGTASMGDTWVFTVTPRPNSSTVVVGTEDSQVAAVNVSFNMVHALYRDQYAFREGLTDVTVQDLLKATNVQIHVKAYVRKIALYDNLIAIQTPTNILIYTARPRSLEYTRTHTINRSPQCSLLVVARSCLFLCNDNRIDLMDFGGAVSGRWSFPAPIGYMKIVGGPPGGECVYLGLGDGSVYCVFADQAEPVKILTHTGFVRCLDVQASKKNIVVADQSGKYRIYNLKTREAVLSDSGASALAWNAVLPDLYVVSSNRQLTVKVGGAVLYQQPVQGPVIGFSGTKIFYFRRNSVRVVDIPLANAVVHYTRAGDCRAAYDVACVGVPDKDWVYLGTQALQRKDWDIARKCFIRLREVQTVDFIDSIEARNMSDAAVDELIAAEILARRGAFADAAAALLRAGQQDRALDALLFCTKPDMSRLMATTDPALMSGLLRRQAAFLESIGDWQSAGALLQSLQCWGELVTLLDAHGETDQLVGIADDVPDTDTSTLTRLADVLATRGDASGTRTILQRLDDPTRLIDHYLTHDMFPEAMGLIHRVPSMADTVRSAYGDHLAVTGDYDAARTLFAESGLVEKAAGILLSLTSVAVNTRDFKAAAKLLCSLRRDELSAVTGEAEEAAVTRDAEHAVRAEQLLDQARAYHSFSFVVDALHRPVSTHRPVDVMRHVLALLARQPDYAGINIAEAAAAAVVTAHEAGVYRVAFDGMARLQKMVLPPRLRPAVEKAYTACLGRRRGEGGAPGERCPRCDKTLPYLARGSGPEACPACGHRPVRSAASSAVLPLLRVDLSELTEEGDPVPADSDLTPSEVVAFAGALPAGLIDTPADMMAQLPGTDLDPEFLTALGVDGVGASLHLTREALSLLTEPERLFVFTPLAPGNPITDSLARPDVFIHRGELDGPDAVHLVMCDACGAVAEEARLEEGDGRCPVCDGPIF